VSSITARFADAVGFAWLDVMVPIGLVALILATRRRKYAMLGNGLAVFYLFFFWSWGLNYHRQPLQSKTPLDSSRMDAAGIESFARDVAQNLNRLHPAKQGRTYEEARIREEAASRVRHVTAVIDGAGWRGASRIKNSLIAGPWFRAASVDGVFNLFGHEPVVSGALLDFEQPFAMSHELAHVYGYAGEGDANLVAVFACLMSDDLDMQYSGWMNLWFYVRDTERDKLLDAGPRQDIDRMIDRLRSGRIQWLSAFQNALLDFYLKSNSVQEGVRSYEEVVTLAAGTQPYWDLYR
jgi:hypothetical protein